MDKMTQPVLNPRLPAKEGLGLDVAGFWEARVPKSCQLAIPMSFANLGSRGVSVPNTARRYKQDADLPAYSSASPLSENFVQNDPVNSKVFGV